MNYLKAFTDKDIFTDPEHPAPKVWTERRTVKLIIQNDRGEIALVTNPVHSFFLLPGGGAESDDLAAEAKREALEEVGWHVEIKKQLGQVEEYRNREAIHSITTCFLATATENHGEDLRDEKEKNNGLVAKWFSQTEARQILAEQVKQLQNGDIGFYNTQFNIVRDQFLFSLLE